MASLTARNWKGRFAALMLIPASLSCAGNSSSGSQSSQLGAIAPFTFNEDHLNCPNRSLIITQPGGFTGAPTVNFMNVKTGASYSQTSTNTSGALSTGMPPGPPAGTYDVLIQAGSGSTSKAGTIDYTTNNCV